jgi:hypothetical protein
MELALFAWKGDISQGFYAVPIEDADLFLERYGPDSDRYPAPWVRIEVPRGPKSLINMTKIVEVFGKGF